MTECPNLEAVSEISGLYGTGTVELGKTETV